MKTCDFLKVWYHFRKYFCIIDGVLVTFGCLLIVRVDQGWDESGALSKNYHFLYKKQGRAPGLSQHSFGVSTAKDPQVTFCSAQLSCSKLLS